MSVQIAVEDGYDYMSTIIRKTGIIYNVEYDKVPLDIVANSERTFPKEWIINNGMDVSDEFINYARPLIGEDFVNIPMIGGLMRFARLKPIFAEKKLKPYEIKG